MKHSLAAVFACLFSLAASAAEAQQAVYQQYPGASPVNAGDQQQNGAYSQANQQYAAQQFAAQQMAAQQQYAAQQQLLREQAQLDQQKAIELAVRKAQRASRPTDYELQEQAIQKGIAENKASQNAGEAPESQSTWSSDQLSGGGHTSKLKGAAVTATKAIGKTAIRALPTVGMIFLARAVSRSGGGSSGLGGLGGYGMNGMNGMNGYSLNGSGYPYGAGGPGMGLNGYGLGQQYPGYWGR